MNMFLKIILLIILLVVMLMASGYMFLQQDKFGRLPEGERLGRISRSPNYQEGTFRNQLPIVRVVDGGGGMGLWLKFLMRSDDSLTPPAALPTVKTDLKAMDPDTDAVVWLGHSSYFIRMGGRTILIDPVFSTYASPIFLSTRAFEGTNLYTAEDMPDIDYLLISHDHWDHLDHDTVTALRPKIRSVITGLGVGEHFARWDSRKIWSTRQTGMIPCNWKTALPFMCSRHVIFPEGCLTATAPCGSLLP
ncbi:MAG: MBL fold metallo-hydrolase [Halodesulfovibrio sp.]